MNGVHQLHWYPVERHEACFAAPAPAVTDAALLPGSSTVLLRRHKYPLPGCHKYPLPGPALVAPCLSEGEGAGRIQPSRWGCSLRP